MKNKEFTLTTGLTPSESRCMERHMQILMDYGNFGRADAKMHGRHGILKGTKILRHYGTKMFQVRGEKAAMQLRSQATKRADRCMDAKKLRGIVGFVGRGFGEVCQNRPVMLNLIQHLSISIDSINIDRLRVCSVARVKRVCNAAAFASSFRPVLGLFSLKTAVRSASPVLTSSFATRVTPVHKSALRAIRKPAMTGRLFSMGDREQVSCAKRTEKNFSLFTSHFSREGKRYAFTLAEVLITLGIIGVVAALTLPSVIEKHKEQVTVNKVKKFYSVISQAMLLAINDNGFPNEWDVPVTDRSEGAQKFMKYIKPYLKISRDCGVEPGCLGYTENVNFLSGGKHSVNYDTDKRYYKVILNDGSYMWLRSSATNYCAETDGGIENTCGAVWTDINGGKAPNTIGKDIFIFNIVQNGQITNTLEDCLKSPWGWGCSGYILKNGNMNYLH